MVLVSSTKPEDNIVVCWNSLLTSPPCSDKALKKVLELTDWYLADKKPDLGLNSI